VSHDLLSPLILPLPKEDIALKVALLVLFIIVGLVALAFFLILFCYGQAMGRHNDIDQFDD
jgi:heme/copper-type cytochrome/quinol oxidase subunit 2